MAPAAEREAGREAKAGRAGDGLELPAEARLEEVEIGDERRRAVVMPLEGWRWRGRVPEEGLLSLGVALLPAEEGAVEQGRRPGRAGRPGKPGPAGRPGPGPGAGRADGGAAGSGEALEVQVGLVRGGQREVLLVGRTAGDAWLDLTARLGDHAGEEVLLEVAPRRVVSRPGEREKDRNLAWSRAFLDTTGPGGAGPTSPNVLLVVVDTLRADRLTPYGCERPTSPAVQSQLADRGVVVDAAYAQAPWTVPSAVSYLTGRYPGEVLSGPMAGYAIPPGVESLGERLAARGYETAAFYGNFVLRDSNGFGRGFATRYTPPPTAESNFLHAGSVNRRALPWLAALQHRPFFLYVHYMDPHDPYLAPDLVDGRSPFYPGYRGDLTGLSVHPLWLGRENLRRPRQDLAHLTALYDSEVATVDRAVGELLGALDPEVASRTLVVFTSDHGEELYDHGGWKHGQTLYDEMIRVPLIFRWDGRLPAGERLAGPVELVDLVPTIAAAVGEEPDPAWQGRDLLPALAGEERLLPRAAFAQHLASGPLRAAAVYAGRKLILFNRAEPFAPADGQVEALWRRDLERLERRELYDLAADPAEARNRAVAEPRAAAALAEVIHQRLDRALPGLRVRSSGLPAGARLGGRIVFERPPDAWHPYFLAAGDGVRLEGPVLTFDWVGEGEDGPGEKGLWVEGDFGAVVGVEARLDGQLLDGPRVLLGDGAPYRGGGVTSGELLAAARPRAPEAPGLRLWTRSRETPPAAGEVDQEVERSLRALGYIR